jgi:large conductance mechanosensitive channel
MPAVSLLLPSSQSYTAWKMVVAGREIPYGLFLGEVVNFLVVALALFLFAVKFLGWVARRRALEEATPQTPPAPSKEQELLAEIRDLLAKRQG